ncbi:trypsin-like peptidase domain-containing protein [Nonomuraea sp. NPDC050663]|uniref:trypsin-like peptidase domain-containing protein n=1 Tax=Nonomuraea sp. NPDC050663 TaxID=3364370 RepID=UPI00379C669E
MRRSLTALVMVGLAVVAVPGQPAWAMTTTATAPATGTVVAAKTNPAVRQISLVVRARLEAADVRLTRDYRALFAQAEAHAKAGRIPGDQQSRFKWVLRAAAKDVHRYLKPGRVPRVTRNAFYGGSCTGSWVTPQGHLLTAAHCVGQPAKESKEIFAQKYLPALIKQDVPRLTEGVEADESVTKLAEQILTEFALKHLKPVKQTQAVYLSGFEQALSGRAPELRLLARGKNLPGADYAILKASGLKNLPTVRLGQDGDVRVGDTLYINGYPGTVDQSQALSKRSKLLPTLTEGIYNARRTTVQKIPYIQTQAPSYGGNSGGPVFGKDGKLIGTLIFGLVDWRIGGETESTAFVLPVSVIRERLAKAGVKPVVSETTELYDRALDAYFAKRYRAALPAFREVLALHPEHLYVRDFIKAIETGKTSA